MGQGKSVCESERERERERGGRRCEQDIIGNGRQIETNHKEKSSLDTS